MINILSKQVAELISAGEVVERPVSVIKELVENSIDAKANRITVEIKNGGTSYMRITDDGIGISQEDVPKAFIRFATSKISTKEDLDKIMTLGFRGEALASVSAVSKVEVFTKTRNETLGTHYKIKGSEETLNERTGCPDGTTITVRDLFYNVPVRAKFLKRDVVEGNAISNIMKKLAVSHPNIAFTFIREGRTEFSTYGDNDQFSAVYSIYGKTFAKDLTPVEYIEGKVSVSGYTVKPLYAKSNRQYQIFFVNGRAVKSEILTTALEEAYSSCIMTGKFPVCILKLDMPPETLDVNIHPTKAEVRFSNENEVFNAVFFSVKNALMQSGLIYDFDLEKTKNSKINATQKITKQEAYIQPNLPDVNVPSDESIINDYEEKNPFIFNADDENESKDFIFTGDIEESSTDFIFNQDISDTPVESTSKSVIEDVSKPVKSIVEENPPKLDTSILKNDTSKLKIKKSNEVQQVKKNPQKEHSLVTKPSFYNKLKPEDIQVRLIGEAFKNYIMVEYEGDIIIIDKHAGHERIIYEKLKSQSAYTDRQILLEPIEVLLTDEQIVALETNRNLTISLGFEFDFSKKPYILVTSVPEILKLEDVETSVIEISNNILKNKKNPQTKIIDDIIHTLACKSAIRSNDKTSDEEMLYLAKNILCDDRIRHCPHGRPVMFIMSKSDLEKQFKRIQS